MPRSDGPTKITVPCCLCERKTEHVIQLPSGWRLRYEIDLTETDAFCPDHAVIQEFTESQCPGCVGGWGDCGLWTSFAYSARRGLTEADFAALGTGVCPRRVNGVLGLSRGKVEDIDLSTRAPKAAGIALVQAIRDYWERFSDIPPAAGRSAVQC